MQSRIREPRTGPPADGGLRERLTERFGAPTALVPVGLAGSTCLVVTRDAYLIAKRMPDAWSPGQLGELFAELARARIPGPQLLDSLPLEASWYALFTYVEGAALRADDPGWRALWASAFGLLRRLAGIPASAAPYDLDARWLARAAELAPGDPAAARLLEYLRTAPPAGEARFAHGDFAPQNLLRTGTGLALIDWADAGVARPGFDAGWLLALNRVGAGPRLPHAELAAALHDPEVPAANRSWYEGLGLLRMRWRAMHLVTTRPELRWLLERTRAGIAGYESERRARG
jgi:aminoglycoside phosphotransferase (APT) family kinase protein